MRTAFATIGNQTEHERNSQNELTKDLSRSWNVCTRDDIRNQNYAYVINARTKLRSWNTKLSKEVKQSSVRR